MLNTDVTLTHSVLTTGALMMLMGISWFSSAGAQEKNEQTSGLQLKSSAFPENGFIPARYTCDGINVSPPLSWNMFPDGVHSWALIADDPDAPSKTWVHWVLYNLPDTVSGLEEAIPTIGTLRGGGMQGTNDFNTFGYGGPCPPSGIHHYHFTLIALDAMLDLKPGATKEQVLTAMQGHIIAQDTLTGLYKRKR